MRASLIRSQIRRELRTRGMVLVKPVERVPSTLQVGLALAAAPMRAELVEAAVV